MRATSLHIARLVFRAAAVSGAALLALVVVQGARAAYAEYRAVVPPRGPVPRPETLPDSFVDAEFPSKSGASMKGWWSPGSNGAAVVLLGGTGADRRGVLNEALFLAAAGYAVLLYDHPGHGESAGPPDWVVEMPQALGGALDWMSAQPGVDPRRMGALGFSMGGATVASVAARDPRLTAVVLLGCYTDADEQTRAEYSRLGAIQGIPAICVMRWAGIAAGSLRPLDDVARMAPRPLLIVAGSDDKTVPTSMARELYAAAHAPKELWIVEGASHGDYADRAGDEYARRLRAFLDGALASPPTAAR